MPAKLKVKFFELRRKEIGPVEIVFVSKAVRNSAKEKKIFIKEIVLGQKMMKMTVPRVEIWI